MKKRVAIKQCAAITPLGDIDETTESLFKGECALKEGPVFGVPAGHSPFTNEKFRDLDTAARHLLTQINISDINQDDTVFIYCSAKGDLRSLEKRVSEAPECTPLLDDQASRICSIMNLHPARTLAISTACASGAVAVEAASEMLEEKEYSNAVLFGFDVISRFVITGFHSLGALSPTRARPFDSTRDGLTLGEGAAVALLSSEPGAPGDILITGSGSSDDANHRTGPSRTGDGLYRAAMAAMAEASLGPADIGAVKCHGTATPYNDAMEAKALRLLFGDSCPPCVSIKGSIGHLSGAGSLVELLLASRFLKRRSIPPTTGYSSCGVEESIGISDTVQRFNKPAVLCLSAGFGGINAATVIEELQA